MHRKTLQGEESAHCVEKHPWAAGSVHEASAFGATSGRAATEPALPLPDEAGERVPDARYEHSLAEFPAFRFGKRRRSEADFIRFTDTIAKPGRPDQSLARTWTVYPSARWGYGGATTQALLFDLHQIWKAQGFGGTRIYFGTLRHLYQCQHPGKNPSTLDYTRLRRDLDILCGYEFDCVNAFWDPVSRTYGDMRAWHLFTGWYEATRARAADPQEELPFGFVELSETFVKIAQERGFFVTGFDSAFFHRLRPIEQRLALYLSKMFVSQELHHRHEEELYKALPIEAVRVTKRRQTLREAVEGLVQKGYSNLAGFSLDGPHATMDSWRASAGGTRSNRTARCVARPSASCPRQRACWSRMSSRRRPIRTAFRCGPARFAALARRPCGMRSRTFEARGASGSVSGNDGIQNAGAWLTTKLMAMAEERGVQITRHVGETRRW